MRLGDVVCIHSKSRYVSLKSFFVFSASTKPLEAAAQPSSCSSCGDLLTLTAQGPYSPGQWKGCAYGGGGERVLGRGIPIGVEGKHIEDDLDDGHCNPHRHEQSNHLIAPGTRTVQHPHHEVEAS